MSTCTPASAGGENALDQRAQWSVALRQLTEAMRLLDESNAPPELGARLDEVIQRLRHAIEIGSHRAS